MWLRSRLGFVCAFAVTLFFGCARPQQGVPPTPPPSVPNPGGSQTGVSQGGSGEARMESDVQMALGNPSKATPDDRANYLFQRPQYTMSYNDELGHPNWVSWHLSAKDLGDVDRGKFQPDTALPQEFTRITPKDYTNTGYDRGHLCPSADRTADEEDNDATFLMSNIMPQAPGNNQGPWKELEEYSRELAKQGNELYIIAGTAGDKRKIARGRLTVPKSVWKVIVVLPEEEGNDVARINAQTRVIAVEMPNISTVRNKDWKSFRVSVDSIEKETGMEMLSNVPKAIQDQLESQVDAE